MARLSKGRSGGGLAGAAALGLALIGLMLIGAFRALCKEEKVLTHADLPEYVAPPAAIHTARSRADIRPQFTESCNAGVCMPATIGGKEKQMLFEVLDELREVQRDWTDPRELPWKSGCDNWTRRVDGTADEAARKIKSLRDTVPGVRHTKAAIEATKACADCKPDRDACAALPQEIERAEAEILGAVVVP